MIKQVTKLLEEGKQVYTGYCMNGLIDGKLLTFEDDKEAINFYANYEAECHKFYIEDGELCQKTIYDPYDCFN